MREKVAIPESEERKRKAKMTSRLCALFLLIDFALLGVVVFELLQLF